MTPFWRVVSTPPNIVIPSIKQRFWTNFSRFEHPPEEAPGGNPSTPPGVSQSSSRSPPRETPGAAEGFPGVPPREPQGDPKRLPQATRPGPRGGQAHGAHAQGDPGPGQAQGAQAGGGARGGLPEAHGVGFPSRQPRRAGHRLPTNDPTGLSKPLRPQPKARQGEPRQGQTRQGKTMQGKAGQTKPGQGNQRYDMRSKNRNSRQKVFRIC